MNGWALLGVLAIVYAGLVTGIAIKKPETLWEMKKIKTFRKILGEKGTIIFFYIWSVLFLALGIWLLMK